jgi:hypothetical protein
MTIINSAKAWRVYAALYIVFIFGILIAAYTGHLSTRLKLFSGDDKIAHALLYGFLGYVFYRATNRRAWRWKRYSFPAAIAVVGILITLEELVQALSPYREWGYLDWFAGIFGLLLFYAVDRKLQE